MWKGREKTQKIEYLENEKSFSDEIENIFHSFQRAISKGLSFGEKKKFDTSFKSTGFINCISLDFGKCHRLR